MNRYKTFWPRFFAGWIDGLIFVPISYFDDTMTSPERGPAVIIAWSVLTYTSFWLYSVCLHAKYGQTLGKMITKVRVLDLSEERIPSFRQAFIRDSGYIAINVMALFYMIHLIASGQSLNSGLNHDWVADFLASASIGWFSLEVISMLTNEKRRAFHDFIAGTVVARNV